MKTIMGTEIPAMNYSNLVQEEGFPKACKNLGYIECALIRIGTEASTKQIGEEIRKILVDQALNSLIKQGKVNYNEKTGTLKMKKKGSNG